MRALIVDDSRAVRSMIARAVRELGFDVVEAGNGREALDQLTITGPLELALVDWNMPVMSGFEFVCAVRADESHNSMSIIMVTSESEIQRVVTALEAGANEYLMKPFTSGALREKLVIAGVITD